MFEYDGALFDAADMERLAAGFAGVVRDLSRDPGMAIGRLDPWAMEGEPGWNGGPAVERVELEDATLLPGMARAVERYAGRVAV